MQIETTPNNKWKMMLEPIVSTTNKNLNGVSHHNHHKYLNQCHLMKELHNQRMIYRHQQSKSQNNNRQNRGNIDLSRSFDEQAYQFGKAEQQHSDEYQLRKIIREELRQNLTSDKKTKQISDDSFGRNEDHNSVEKRLTKILMKSKDEESRSDDITAQSTQLSTTLLKLIEQNSQMFNQRFTKLESDNLEFKKLQSQQREEQSNVNKSLSKELTHQSETIKHMQQKLDYLMKDNDHRKEDGNQSFRTSSNTLNDIQKFKNEISQRVQTINLYSLEKYNKMKEQISNEIEAFKKQQESKIDEVIRCSSMKEEQLENYSLDQIESFKQDLDQFRLIMISNIDQIVKSDKLKSNLFNQLTNHLQGDPILVDGVQVVTTTEEEEDKQQAKQVRLVEEEIEMNQGYIRSTITDLKSIVGNLAEQLEWVQRENVLLKDQMSDVLRKVEVSNAEILNKQMMAEIEVLQAQVEKQEKKLLRDQELSQIQINQQFETESRKDQNQHINKLIPFKSIRKNRLFQNSSDLENNSNIDLKRRLRDYTVDERIRKRRQLSINEIEQINDIKSRFQDNIQRFFSQQKHHPKKDALLFGVQEEFKNEKKIRKTRWTDEYKKKQGLLAVEGSKQDLLEFSPSPVALRVPEIHSKESPLTMSQLNSNKEVVMFSNQKHSATVIKKKQQQLIRQRI